MQQLRPRVVTSQPRVATPGCNPGLRRRAGRQQRHAAATTPGCEEERKDIKGRQRLRPRVAKKSGRTSKACSSYDPGLRRRAERHQRQAAATTPGCEEERKDIKGRQRLRPRVRKEEREV